MRRVDPFDRRSLIFSIILHASLLGIVLLSMMRSEPVVEFVAYEVDLVSPPPAVEAEEYTPAREELVVERPEPEPAPPEPEPEPEPQVTVDEPEPTPEPEPEPEPTPTPAPPTPTNQPDPEPPADPTPAAGPDADPTAERSGEGINVRMEGLRRDYPEYWNNIIRQIERCFRPPAGNWATTVMFNIRRDGSVAEVEFERRSGNTAFDYLAMEAVECAGQGRFGPLPADLPYQYQPIRFEFRPRGGEQ
jgi:outer membrane biosynthesis protein TonB